MAIPLKYNIRNLMVRKVSTGMTVFVIALETGLRKSDLLNLLWPQVDLPGGFIRVFMRKTKRFAVIPISSLCREALLACKARPVASRFVFTNADGTRVAEMAVRRAFLLAKRLAGITRRFRFHDFRHSAAVTLASEGVSPQVIQQVLGHASLRMSERYLRVNVAALDAARRALDAHRMRIDQTTNSEPTSTGSHGSQRA